MVTPRIPGARVGRPRKPPLEDSEPTKARNRPKVPFLQDPDRYLVAFYEAHAFGMSERQAATIVAALTVGNEIPRSLLTEFGKKSDAPRRHASEQEIARLKISHVVRDCPPGMSVVGWWAGKIDADPTLEGVFINTQEGSSAKTIEGRAATIRGKARKWQRNQDERYWLNTMAAIFAIALKTSFNEQRYKPHEPEIRRLLLALAFQIKETKFVIDAVLPMIGVGLGGREHP